MKFLAVAVGLLLLVGCGGEPAETVPSGSVPLVTFHGDGCHVAPLAGLLVADPQYGTRIALGDEGTEPGPIVVWLSGYTASRQGSEIEVRNPQGAVVAITGRRYALTGGWLDAKDVGVPRVRPDGSRGVWWACAGVVPWNPKAPDA
jgi:hypothetical protein